LKEIVSDRGEHREIPKSLYRRMSDIDKKELDMADRVRACCCFWNEYGRRTSLDQCSFVCCMVTVLSESASITVTCIRICIESFPTR
jgi:hypothetical protein